jgi:hypothetical protein
VSLADIFFLVYIDSIPHTLFFFHITGFLFVWLAFGVWV